MLESNSPESGVRDDEMQLVAELHFVLGKSDSSAGDSTVQQSNDEYMAASKEPRETSCVNTWISKGGTVAEFKAVLESQDLLLPTPDSDMEEFLVEARLAPTSSPLDDNFVIPEGTDLLHVTVRPRSQANSSQERPVNLFTSSSSATDGTQAVSQEPPRVRPIFPTEIPTAIPRCDGASDNEWQNDLRDMLLVGPAPATAPRVEPVAVPVQPSGISLPVPQGSFLFGPGMTEDFGNIGAFPNQALIQQFANSAIKNIMSNPTTLQTLMESNPEMRDLRERNPELNHLLNDTELLKQSMEVMRNPSLMREMINNTDRALNNIDAIPGGFNALRRVYQSIQEPIWDAAMVGGRSSGLECEPPRVYDLRTDQAPNTQAVPNPWAPRASAGAPEVSPFSSPQPFATTNVPSMPQQAHHEQHSASSILSDPAVLSLYSSALPSLIRMSTSEASSSMSRAPTTSGPNMSSRSMSTDQLGVALRVAAALSGAAAEETRVAPERRDSIALATAPSSPTGTSGLLAHDAIGAPHSSRSSSRPPATEDDCGVDPSRGKQLMTDPAPQAARQLAESSRLRDDDLGSIEPGGKLDGSAEPGSIQAPYGLGNATAECDEPSATGYCRHPSIDVANGRSSTGCTNPTGLVSQAALLPSLLPSLLAPPFSTPLPSPTSSSSPRDPESQVASAGYTGARRVVPNRRTGELPEGCGDSNDTGASTSSSQCSLNISGGHSVPGLRSNNGTAPATPRRTDSESGGPLRSHFMMSSGMLPFPSYFRFFSGTGGSSGSGFLPGAPHISGASRPSSSESLGRSNSPARVNQENNSRSCNTPSQGVPPPSSNAASQPSEQHHQQQSEKRQQ